MGKNRKKAPRRAPSNRGGEEIVFDPQARQAYLQGFSTRKRERRVYGLAMQKVKDRKAKLEQRAEMKKAVLEQIEEAEQQKEDLLSGILEEIGGPRLPTASPAMETHNSRMEEPVEHVQTYQDEATQSHWGGAVIVTTSTRLPDDSDDEDDGDERQHHHHHKSNTQTTQPHQNPDRRAKKKSVDAAQQYAGNVERFMNELKGKIPGKKKRDAKHAKLHHRGNHGAANMKGMANSTDLKIAQKALSRSEAKGRGGGGKGVRGGGGKKRKGGR